MGSQKFLVPIKKGSKNILRPENFGYTKNLGHQKFWAIYGPPKKNFGSKNLRQQKIIGSK